MACFHHTRILNFVLIVLFFSTPEIILSQDEEGRVMDVLEGFIATENPTDAINDLLSIQQIVPRASDSLQGQYFLNLGIAYGQLNKADSSFLYLKNMTFVDLII